MHRINLIKILTLLLLLVTISVNAQHDASNEAHGESSHEDKDLRTEIKEYIAHHLLDSYDFTLFSWTTDAGEHKYFSAPLPVILWDGGLKVFSSSKFNHGETLAEVDGNYYKLYHSKIYKTDAVGTINYDEEHHATNVKPLDFSITKNVVFIIAVSVLMLFIFIRMAKSYQNNVLPKGIGRLLEPLIVYIRDDVAIPNIGEKHYRKYMSYLLTVFFFVWIINLLGLTPLGVNVTNNIAVTFALALITYLLTTFTANKNYWKHIFWMPGVPTLMKIILAPIELLGTFIKPFSLMIRLYANITAGHIVLMSIIGLMFIFKSWIGSPLSFGLSFALALLELLVAALQAYIFTMLSALYFGMAVEEHDDH
ncbi:F0F1 ATP synthase subunit A [Lutibacter sp. A80]|uniref:F0F1 ATP synthase subunit A n=1 Tax=Lutibacter sp. A80 TaxID=2918453 RepID=UPI001F05B43E|nr:F0F1 ATP synthase subunit A [Lutibacter sp. A80]UMB59791.1 F0F1 ATP synthase subunit A [Lutibacter sp. A80]